MDKIEVSLNLGAVAPVLDFLQPVLKTLESETAFAPEMAEADRDLAGVWRDGLIHSQMEDCRRLMSLFNAEFLESGRIQIDREGADPILRAAAALRLKLRETALKALSDETLQLDDLDVSTLSDQEHLGFAAYRFLVRLQEVIIQHLVE